MQRRRRGRGEERIWTQLEERKFTHWVHSQKLGSFSPEHATSDRMEDTGEAQKPRVVSSDSAYGSSVVDTDTEDGETSTDSSFPYNEDITHKVMI